LRADLGDARPLAQCTGCDALVSAGPLDLAVRWLSAQQWAPPRVVAFGSTSVHSKQSSCDAGERALALRLRTAEDALLAWARQHGSAGTLLRPTLVYGAAMDRNLSRLAQLARRLGWIAIPARAHGRRQPVHAADLAGTALNALALVRTPRPAYDLAGGETLAYRDMVARVLEALPRRPLL